MILLVLCITLGVLIVLFLTFLWYRRRSFFMRLERITMDPSSNGELRLLTYNVAGLPERLSSAIMPRRQSIERIGELVGEFDIVNVQEDFNYNNALYSRNKHLYRTKHKGKIPLGDGLNTLSKYPILELKRVPWRNCTGSDCLTPKGFSYCLIKLAKDVYVDVYNVHANAHHAPNAARARRKNLQQLSRYIQDHSAGKPLLVFGDFNANYGFKLDNLHDFAKQTMLKDSWVELFVKGQFPAIDMQFKPHPILELSNETESIDKVYFRNSEKLKFFPLAYHIENDLFQDVNGTPLSDHLAVSLTLHWEWTK